MRPGHHALPQAALPSGLYALAVELLRFLIPPGESQAFLAAAAGEAQRPAEARDRPSADQPPGVRRHARSREPQMRRFKL